MNKFIILIPEEYDQYELEIPYPYVTMLTKENVQSWLDELAAKLAEYKNQKGSWKSIIKGFDLHLGSYNFQEYQLTESDRYIQKPKKIRVLDLEEWVIENNINSKHERYP